MIRTQIQCDEDQYRKLKELASRQNVSIATLVRRAVEPLLLTGKPGRSALYRQALKVAGKYQAEKSDIAMEHDLYLEYIRRNRVLIPPPSLPFWLATITCMYGPGKFLPNVCGLKFNCFPVPMFWLKPWPCSSGGLVWTRSSIFMTKWFPCWTLSGLTGNGMEKP